MAYSKTIWLETSMSTADKLTSLDNLEGMYGEATAYIAAVSHSSQYYSEAEASAKYFTSGNDGAGTGLICSKLDGYTADEIIAGGSPSGAICWWSGSEASIPSGWLLCNGLNGTPDLRNRFVVGAGSHYSKGDTGGANTITTSATITIAGHALTADETPKHTHGSITDYYPIPPYHAEGNVSAGWFSFQSNASNTEYTGYSGGGDAHSHTATFDGTDDQVRVPPFYSLCYIMKS